MFALESYMVDPIDYIAIEGANMDALKIYNEHSKSARAKLREGNSLFKEGDKAGAKAKYTEARQEMLACKQAVTAIPPSVGSAVISNIGYGIIGFGSSLLGARIGTAAGIHGSEKVIQKAINKNRSSDQQLKVKFPKGFKKGITNRTMKGVTGLSAGIGAGLAGLGTLVAFLNGLREKKQDGHELNANDFNVFIKCITSSIDSLIKLLNSKIGECQ